MIRRINLFGPSGCGKSTLAADIYAALKRDRYSVELVREEIKLMAYKQEFPVSYKQAAIFARQLDQEDEFLQHVDLIVSDSPIHMNVAYSKLYDFDGWPELLALANKWEASKPSLNFFLHRNFPYVQEGRYQSEEQSARVAEAIREMMVSHLDPARTFLDPLFFDGILEIIKKETKPHGG